MSGFSKKGDGRQNRLNNFLSSTKLAGSNGFLRTDCSHSASAECAASASVAPTHAAQLLFLSLRRHAEKCAANLLKESKQGGGENTTACRSEIMDWPSDIERKILVDVTSKRLQEIVRRVLEQASPRRDGSLSNPFFTSNEPRPTLRISKQRTVAAPIPPLLVPLYEAYDASTEFCMSNGVKLLSESAMSNLEETSEYAHLAFIYAGMGHITLYVYVPKFQTIIPLLDGGSNAYDRHDNAQKRNAMLEQYVKTGIDPDNRVVSFIEWCEHTLLTPVPHL